jgi:hypothetical protein
MKRLMVLFFAVSIGGLLITGTAGQQPGIHKKGEEVSPTPSAIKGPGLTLNPQFGKVPLYFIPNKGQVNEAAKYYAKTSRYTLWITKGGLVFDSVRKVKAEEGATPPTFAGHPSQEGAIERDVSRLMFLNANKNPGIVPLGTTRYKVNYFKGKDPAKWKKSVPTSAAVLYRNIYKNIDLKVYGNETQIEYDWIVKPGGNPEIIHFEYENVKGTRISKKGNLFIATKFGELLHKKPFSYQLIDGKKVKLNSHFEKISKNTYGFRIRAYNRNYELIIDPVVSLDYSSYLGGSGGDEGYGIKVDNNNNVYVGGYTNSYDFPIKNSNCGPRPRAHIFVTKFDSCGSELIYSTYLSGDGGESCYDIDLSTNNEVYLTGYSNSTNFPASNGSAGYTDVIVCVLYANGALKYSRFIGGSGFDHGFAIAVDNTGNAYITGDTSSTDFPTLNAYQNILKGQSANGFVVKLNPDGLELVYSTYLGGSKSDFGFGIDVDNPGFCYVIGTTGSKNFPLKNPYQTELKGWESDIFVTKLKPDGSGLVYSTYVGGSNEERAGSIFVDNSGSAYVSGLTYSTDFPTKNAYKNSLAGSADIFVSKFSQDGSSLVFSTYLGGAWTTHNVLRSDVTVDHSDNVLVATATRNINFPTKNPLQSSNAGGLDAVICKLSPNCSKLIYSTYLGGSEDDRANAITIDKSGNVYITGTTFSSNFPTVNPFQDFYAGADDRYHGDAIISKLSFTYDLTVQSTPDPGIPVTVTPSDTNGNGYGNTNFTRIYPQGEMVTLTAPGTYNQKVFHKWTIDGVNYFKRTVNVTMNENHSATVKYRTPIITHTLNVQSTPDTGALIAVTPTDNNGKGDGNTNFNRTYNQGKTVTLTAPETFNGKEFYKWTIDGLEKVERTIQVTMNKDHAVAAVYKSPPRIYLSCTRLNFGSCPGSASTGAQTFFIANTGGLPLDWTVSDNANWLDCSPADGTNHGEVSVSVNGSGLAAGIYTGTVTVSDPQADNSPQTVTVSLAVYSAGNSDKPFGDFATPLDGTTVMSSIPVTGWALDDIEVMSVKIYRQENNDLVYIGDAVFVEGARPDVELAFPNHPKSYRAGWGYMLLTNFLPNGGNGSFTLHAIATDKEGHHVTLGTKTIQCDNAHAVRPFGAIDLPIQGGTASGKNYRNQGWVLTPLPNKIPEDGHTIFVWIDGFTISNPIYNIYRTDIAELFPGYANSDGAMAYIDFDTTAYENGVHTIQWTAMDNAGNVDGIGSRYFTIQNTGEGAAHTSRSVMRKTSDFKIQSSMFNLSLSQIPQDYSNPVRVKKGYNRNIRPHKRFPDEYGNITVKIKELERLEIDFGTAANVCGFQMVGHRLRELPIGSFFDSQKGIFCWQPGPGFVGRYQLVFIEITPAGEMRKRIITTHILPRFIGKTYPLRY